MAAYGAQELIELLSRYGIQNRLYHHDPIFGAKDVDVLEKVKGEIPGAHVKNLFLKSERGFFLVTLLDEDRVNLKELKKTLQVKDLSFANADTLMRVLGVKPGSVTPLGVINDVRREVCVVIDEAVFSFEQINVHPLQNDQTLSLRREDFTRFFTITGHNVTTMRVPKQTRD